MKTIETLDFLQSIENYLKENLNFKFGNNINVTLSILEKKAHYSNEVFLTLKDFGNFFAKEYIGAEWEKKIDDIMNIGNIDDIKSVLAPRNHGAKLTPILVAKFNFRVRDQLRGESDFIQEYNGDVLVNQYVITQYYLNHFLGKKNLVEISASWEDSSGLIMSSVCDYFRDQNKFIKQRIKAN